MSCCLGQEQKVCSKIVTVSGRSWFSTSKNIYLQLLPLFSEKNCISGHFDKHKLSDHDWLQLFFNGHTKLTVRKA